MATKPTNVPKWAEQTQIDPVSGQTNKVEPPGTYEDGGWSRREIPPRQYWNWMLWKIGQWITWLAAGTSSPTASTVMERDANGRTQVADPVGDNDAVNKGFLDREIYRMELLGDFDAGGFVVATRIGNLVHIQSEGTVSHSQTKNPSSGNFLPSSFHPSGNNASNTYLNDGSFQTSDAAVNSGGAITVRHRDTDQDNPAPTPTSTKQEISITYYIW